MEEEEKKRGNKRQGRAGQSRGDRRERYDLVMLLNGGGYGS